MKKLQNPEDILGRRIGRLTVLEHLGRLNGRRHFYRCSCDCGNTIEVMRDSLLLQKSKSCGCVRIAKITKHSEHQSITYSTWIGMKTRCLNPKAPHFDRYGGRGIQVCERWLDYKNFRDDMGERPSLAHTLERKDNDGHYCPDNCEWATRKAQANNRSDNHIIEHNGERHTLTVWCRRLGLSYDVVRSRIRLGWDFEKSVNTPIITDHERDKTTGQYKRL